MSRGSSDQNSTGDRHLCFPSLSPIVLRVVVPRFSRVSAARSSSRTPDKDGGGGGAVGRAGGQRGEEECAPRDGERRRVSCAGGDARERVCPSLT